MKLFSPMVWRNSMSSHVVGLARPAKTKDLTKIVKLAKKPGKIGLDFTKWNIDEFQSKLAGKRGSITMLDLKKNDNRNIDKILSNSLNS